MRAGCIVEESDKRAEIRVLDYASPHKPRRPPIDPVVKKRILRSILMGGGLALIPWFVLLEAIVRAVPPMHPAVTFKNAIPILAATLVSLAGLALVVYGAFLLLVRVRRMVWGLIVLGSTVPILWFTVGEMLDGGRAPHWTRGPALAVRGVNYQIVYCTEAPWHEIWLVSHEQKSLFKSTFMFHALVSQGYFPVIQPVGAVAYPHRSLFVAPNGWICYIHDDEALAYDPARRQQWTTDYPQNGQGLPPFFLMDNVGAVAPADAAAFLRASAWLGRYRSFSEALASDLHHANPQVRKLALGAYQVIYPPATQAGNGP
jgi:hypothetical protein